MRVGLFLRSLQAPMHYSFSRNMWSSPCCDRWSLISTVEGFGFQQALTKICLYESVPVKLSILHCNYVVVWHRMRATFMLKLHCTSQQIHESACPCFTLNPLFTHMICYCQSVWMWNHPAGGRLTIVAHNRCKSFISIILRTIGHCVFSPGLCAYNTEEGQFDQEWRETEEMLVCWWKRDAGLFPKMELMHINSRLVSVLMEKIEKAFSSDTKLEMLQSAGWVIKIFKTFPMRVKDWILM